MTDQPLLEARKIVKSFGRVQALTGANFTVYPKEVVALVGDNGAGKSTLMKILSGLYAPSQGVLLFEGAPVRFHSPRDARAVGIEMVYQDLALAGNLSIHENIYLGREPGRKLAGLTLVDRALSRAMAAAHLDKLRIEVKSIDQNVEELSGGQRQGVAIARATHWASKLVLMDEPTAALGVAETMKVENIIKGLRDRNLAVLIISHSLDQVFRLSDRICVLRRGVQVGIRRTRETTNNEIVSMITGLA